MDATYQRSFVNQTASEIASLIAARHNLDARVTNTSTLIGSYRQGTYCNLVLNDHSQIVSEWDMLRTLADQEGFEFFTAGATLVFVSQEELTTNHVFLSRSDVIGLRFQRQCLIYDQPQFVVKSWNSWLAQMFDNTDGIPPSASFQNEIGGSDPIEFSLIRPNLLPQDISQLSSNWLSKIAETALRMELTVPGNIGLKPYDIISLDGYLIGSHTNYLVREVRCHLSSTLGFVQLVNACPFSGDARSTTELGSG
jgi:hypothetical protein